MTKNNLKDEHHFDFVCPLCHEKLNILEEHAECLQCKKKYRIASNIIDFRSSDSYWSNISRERINNVILESKKSKDWYSTVLKLIPEYVPHIAPYYRADAQFLWPINENSIILDAGSMWGGLAVPIAQYCKKIYAVDQTFESLDFLNTRIEQSDIDNIVTTAASLSKLPFPNNFFDVVVLNGVLEWVALEDKVVLEKHWTNKREKILRHKRNPKEMQIEVLTELSRVLKENGTLCLSIENAIGWPYLLGVWRDDHMNLLFTSFLPRFISNFIAKKKLKCEYRTYTYSQYGLKLLLKRAGFTKLNFYGAFDHYINPRYIIPFEGIKNYKQFALPINHPKANNLLKFLVQMFPRKILKYFSPSFIVVANKTQEIESTPRIIKSLFSSGIIEGKIEDWQMIKTNSRSENWHSLNFQIYSKIKSNKYFLKISRDKNNSSIIKDEIKNLTRIHNLLKDTALENSYPKVIFESENLNLSFFLMTYIKGDQISLNKKFDFSKRSIREYEHSVKLSINYLSSFQNITSQKRVEGKKYLFEKLVYYEAKALESNKNINIELILNSIAFLKNKVNLLEEFNLVLSACHGDFDFDNIIFDKNIVKITDFEHFEEVGFPFLDISHLIYNPLLMAYEKLKCTENFKEYLHKQKIDHLILALLKNYSMKMNIPESIVDYLGPFVTLEHLFKEYPSYRDPSTLPFGSPTAIRCFLNGYLNNK